MTNPTKPTTNLTREELEDQLVAMLIDKLHIDHPDGVVVESRDIYAAMHHHGTPLIDTYTQAKEREARIDENRLAAKEETSIQSLRRLKARWHELTALKTKQEVAN